MAYPLLNTDTIRSLTEMGAIIGNDKYFWSIFATFKDSFRSDLDALEDYIKKDHVDMVRVIAHRMKSSAKTIGAAALGERFHDIETQIVRGEIDLKKLLADMHEIRELFRQTLVNFDKYLN